MSRKLIKFIGYYISLLRPTITQVVRKHEKFPSRREYKDFNREISRTDNLIFFEKYRYSNGRKNGGRRVGRYFFLSKEIDICVKKRNISIMLKYMKKDRKI